MNIVDALDHARTALLGVAVDTPGLRVLVTRRDWRLAAQSTLGVTLLALATLFAPGALFVLGPILFGVAHVTSDVRHLVLRRDLPRAWVRMIVVAVVVMIAMRGAELVAPQATSYALVEAVVGWGWIGVGVVMGARVARASRSLLLLCPVLAIAALWLRHPTAARAIFAYAHNVVALVLWVALFRRRRAFAIPALVVVALVVGCFVSGALLQSVSFDGPWSARLAREATSIASSIVSPRTALGLGLGYVFLQAVHYSVWLAWIPQDDLRGEGTTTFRMTARALHRELGAVGIALVAVAFGLVAIGSLTALHETRAAYLSVASFHGFLELAALAFFAARGGIHAVAEGESGGSIKALEGTR